MILADFLTRVPGARGAALVDAEGETVDYAGRVDAFELRVAAAHFRIVFATVQAQPFLRDAASVVVRASHRSFLVHAIAEGYALFVQFSKGAGLGGWHRALPLCAQRLSHEAGWRAAEAAWFPVEIMSDERLRPLAIRVGCAERQLEVMGALANSGRERAWRVRVDTGAEVMLVREPGGAWYADESLP